MEKLLISYTPFEIRVGLVEGSQLVEFYVERPSEKGLVGNIYKGRVVRVVPGINSAFLDLGLPRTAFLFCDDIMPLGEIDWEKENLTVTNLHEILKEGQEILVQVIKEPIGNKGARVSTNLTLPGHYLVYLPYINKIGISRKIKAEKERKRLKELLEKLRPQNTGWIIRTAAVEATEEELKSEIEFLLNLWTEIKEKAEKCRAPALVYEELNIALRAIRDLFNKEITSIVVDNRDFYEEIKTFLKKGLISTGCSVEDIGLSLSPTVYFAQFNLNSDAIAMVTASHNENGWTGIKMGIDKGLTHSSEEMKDLKEIVLNKNFVEGKGSYKKIDGFKEIYIQNLSKEKIKNKIDTVIKDKNISNFLYKFLEK